MAFSVSTVAAAGLTLAMAGAAHGFVLWATPNGSGSFFTYSGGGSDNGFFGNPTLAGGGTQFLFFPPAFQATSSNGTAGQMNDRMEVHLISNAGFRFTQISVQEFGDWTITGIGTVQAQGTMFLTDNLTGPPPAINPLQMSPTMPISTQGSGQWSGTAVRNLLLTGHDWTDLTFVLTNNLQATTGAGGASQIRKTVVGGPAVIITILPTPGALALLGFSGLVLARRRR